MFKMTKIRILEGKHSKVREGFSFSNSKVFLFKDNNNNKKVLKNLKEIKKGMRLLMCQSMVSFLIISEIKEVGKIHRINANKEKLTFITTTSEYEIEHISEENNV